MDEDLSNMPVPNKVFHDSIDKSLRSIEVDVAIVIDKLNSLNVNKSHGPDELHGKLVMELREERAPSLVNIFKASLETGVFPQDFRDATVVPLHKKGGRDKAEKGQLSYNIVLNYTFQHFSYNTC